MNQIKLLVLSLISLLTRAVSTNRDDEAQLKQIQTQFKAQSDALTAMTADDAQLKSDATQNAADIADLQAQLQAALDQAAAATPPTPDHVAEAQTSLGSGQTTAGTPPGGSDAGTASANSDAASTAGEAGDAAGAPAGAPAPAGDGTASTTGDSN